MRKEREMKIQFIHDNYTIYVSKANVKTYITHLENQGFSLTWINPHTVAY